MRGKDNRRYNGTFYLGITPAYAGKRSGEKIKHISTKGSPPPMRGKVLAAVAVLHSGRITPAYAGKSSAAIRRGRAYQDHPRLCGEKCRRLRLCQRHQGSPPPMRGKEFVRLHKKQFVRITPAYAGKRIADFYGVSID